MPKLILKFDDRELQECAVGNEPVSIGRRPDNVIIIDHPVVSARHARVFREGNHYVIEDLRSTNGTFVNQQPIARHLLIEGDTVAVGKHTLVFSLAGSETEPAAAGDAAASLPEIDGGPLVTLNQQLSGQRLGPASQVDLMVPKTAIPTAPARTGSVRVVSGTSDRSEYALVAVTTIIGKSETAQIRTKGWLKPKVAAAIARKGDGFTVTPMGAPVTVNGETISSRQELADGDRIEVSGLTLEFKLSG